MSNGTGTGGGASAPGTSILVAGAAASLNTGGAGRNAPFNLSGHAATHESDEAFNLKSKLSLLEKDLERRQESYITRERAYKTRIEELEEELSRQKQRKSGWVGTDSKMSVLKQMQTQIVENVELVQDRTAHILQEQERDLLRAFRARLFDVQTELDKERGRKDDGAAQWIERCRQLEAEVEWAKEVADRLERVNQNLVSEAARLKTQFSNQEEDRNHLVKQLVAVKRINASLKSEHAALKDEHDLLKTQLRSIQEGTASGNGLVTATGRIVGNTGGGGMIEATGAGSVRAENEERLKEANARLRRLLAEERRSLQQVRQNYATELKSRTEMELLLRNCVEDVRHEISRRYLLLWHMETTDSHY
jgi:DNA repair exonuclease SbcCD ATPase subunit